MTDEEKARILLQAWIKETQGMMEVAARHAIIYGSYVDDTEESRLEGVNVDFTD